MTKRLLLLVNAAFIAGSASAGVNYRLYEKTTENGGPNGYACVSETKYNTDVTLGSVTRHCQNYVLECCDPGITACVFSIPPSHLSLPFVDQQVASQINAGHYTGHFYMNGIEGPGDADNLASPIDMPGYFWSTEGASVKIAILDFEDGTGE